MPSLNADTVRAVASVESAVDPIVDWSELHRLLIASFAYMDGRIDPPSSLLAMSAADVESKAAHERLMIATVEDVLVGCLFGRPQSGWLYVGKMAVEPARQGMGIGRMLMAEARELAAGAGLQGLELETRIELIENHQAFARLGFVRIAEQSHAGYSKPTSITMRSALAGPQH